MRKPGSKERIKQFLLGNVGTVVTSVQIRDAAGLSVSEWARRLRELREVGWPILSNNDSAKLKPGEYVLEATPPEKAEVAFSRPISRSCAPRFSTETALRVKCAD